MRNVVQSNVLMAMMENEPGILRVDLTANDITAEPKVLNYSLIFMLAPTHDTVTVSPSLCPTNKIAPHRRIASSGRTFAAYYDLLLAPNAQNANPQPQYPLQEQPQPDQPGDCGEIEDYDENDLSAVTQNRKRSQRTDSRFFFGGIFHRPQQLPSYTPPAPSSDDITRPGVAPTRPVRPTRLPQRPPYWSGGFFGQNQYQTPSYQEPSDDIKPVHEAADISEVAQTYRPGLVGGPLGHVVGVSQASPTLPTSDEKTRRRLEYLANLRQRTSTTQPTFYTTSRPRPRQLNSGESVLGSFLSLLFK